MYTILIIEDEPRVASLLMNGLEENGYQTMVAYDGLMGLRLFQAHTFDLVISDIVLPKMDGFELTKEIRKSNPRIPILMLTALGSTNDKLDGFDAGADDYMVRVECQNQSSIETCLGKCTGIAAGTCLCGSAH